jgi:uncharacterized membrane protein HdeD (DUF308 family)
MTGHQVTAEHRSINKQLTDRRSIMSGLSATPEFRAPVKSVYAAAQKLTGYWWVLVAAGIAWIAAALVILQFNHASITTVGVLVGLMFVGVAIENLALGSLDVPMRWAWTLFGVLFLASAVVCFATPASTFAGLADVLGVLFLIVGLWWMMRAFLERPVNPLWWMGLISGILMTAMAFWTSGQFYIHRAYVLLVFAGVWALMQGITSLLRGFELRELHEEL